MPVPNETRDVQALVKGGDSQELPPSGAGPLGMSQRQMRLNFLWSLYANKHYEARKVDWNGQEVLDPLEHEVVARAGFVPPGFITAGQETPLKFRKPVAPYGLVTAIVNRFTGLLFSEQRHPKVTCPEDRITEAWLSAFCKRTRFWARWIHARRYGGACGAVAVGFKFVRGVPYVEVHDPRWCFVELGEDDGQTVVKFEKRYMYPREERNPDGLLETRWYWYRRLIDNMADVTWHGVPAGEGEPEWTKYEARTIEHGLGFVPVVWVRNTDVEDELDGTPDADMVVDQVHAIDMLQSQAFRGTIANLDPTLKVKTDKEMGPDLRKGSDNAIVLGAGDDAGYMEITGAGIKLAMELSQKYREQALETARCVLDNNMHGPARTASEVNQNYSSMLEAADELREQWGENGVKRLLNLVLRAVRVLANPTPKKRSDGVTEIVKQVIKLPGNPQLGTGDDLELVWPPYEKLSVADSSDAVTSAVAAKQGGLIDSRTATQAVAPYFGVEDVDTVARKAQAEADAAMGSLTRQLGDLDEGTELE